MAASLRDIQEREERMRREAQQGQRETVGGDGEPAHPKGITLACVPQYIACRCVWVLVHAHHGACLPASDGGLRFEEEKSRRASAFSCSAYQRHLTCLSHARRDSLRDKSLLATPKPAIWGNAAAKPAKDAQGVEQQRKMPTGGAAAGQAKQQAPAQKQQVRLSHTVCTQIPFLISDSGFLIPHATWP
jgi:hypothetical protein